MKLFSVTSFVFCPRTEIKDLQSVLHIYSVSPLAIYEGFLKGRGYKIPDDSKVYDYHLFCEKQLESNPMSIKRIYIKLVEPVDCIGNWI